MTQVRPRRSIISRWLEPPPHLACGDQRRHFVLATWMYVFGGGLLGFFIPFDLLYTGYVHHAAAQAVALAAITIAYVIYRRRGDARVISWVSSGTVGILIVFLIATGNPYDAVFAWAAFFPAIPFFMLGAGWGLAAALAFVLGLGIALADMLARGVPGVTLVAIYNTLGATLGITAILYYYEHGRATAQRTMEEAANTDFLTGLVNRRHFQTVFELEAERARRHHRPLTLLLVDLDHFKAINDTHGHDVGDQVLRHAAQRMVDGTRRQDVAGRIGGEEFALLLPETAEAQGVAVAEKLRRTLDAQPVDGVRVTASIGVAEMRWGDDWTALFATADQRLYAAKAGGRNRVVGGEPARAEAGEPAPRAANVVDFSAAE
ncbi:diguanylate cyclase [Caenispirillum salinarum]|uniref:GGDEF domain-containing protein n=1 Tax=Caenispirillum salinarum TaxID=859058 RepID=UPI00384DE2F8